MTDVHTTSKTVKPKSIPVADAPSINGETNWSNGSFPDFPIMFRTFAESSAEKSKANWETMKSATDKFNAAAQETYSGAVQESLDYMAKVMATASWNVHSAFDLANALMQARTPADILEVSTAHARKQMEKIAEQNRHLWSAAQKLAATMTKPLADIQKS